MDFIDDFTLDHILKEQSKKQMLTM